MAVAGSDKGGTTCVGASSEDEDEDDDAAREDIGLICPALINVLREKRKLYAVSEAASSESGGDLSAGTTLASGGQHTCIKHVLAVYVSVSVNDVCSPMCWLSLPEDVRSAHMLAMCRAVREEELRALAGYESALVIRFRLCSCR